MGLTVLLVSGTEGALKTGLALAVLLRTGLLQCAVTFRAFPIFWLALLPFKTNWLSSHFLLLGVLGVEAFSFLMLLKSDLLILGVLRLLVTFSWSFNESSLMMSKMVSSRETMISFTGLLLDFVIFLAGPLCAKTLPDLKLQIFETKKGLNKKMEATY